jgi:hypothetical protein
MSWAEPQRHGQILSQFRNSSASRQASLSLDGAMKYLLLIILLALLVFLGNQLYQQFFLGRY